MRASSPLLSCLALSALVFAGCSSTPQDRISQNRGYYESLPADVQRKVSAGQVDVGFTPDMVTLALGKPTRKVTRAEAVGQSEEWIYIKSKPQFSFGVGMGSANYGHGSSTATGVGVSTTTPPREDYLRVVFRDGKVSSVEKDVGS